MPEDKKKPGPAKRVSDVLFMAGMLTLAFYVANELFFDPSNKGPETSRKAYSEVVDAARDGKIKDITQQGNRITGYFKDKSGNETKFESILSDRDPAALKEIREAGVKVEVKEQPAAPWYYNPWVLALAPIPLFLGFWILMMRKMQGGAGGAMKFTQSKAKLFDGNGKKVTFADVAGVDEAKHDVQEIVDFLKDQKKFNAVGGRVPKGILLVGPPGTGKTLLARAVAGEANVPFFSVSGSEFVEMFVGVGAGRVRDLFEKGKANAPCIIFIDELDAVGRQRGAGLGGGNDEREQTLNQILVEMGGFEGGSGIIVMAATNRPDVLDPALLRPGRFDRQVTVDRPSLKGREDILNIYAKKVKCEADVDINKVARGTTGFSGADLENLINEAALLAARKNRQAIGNEDISAAWDKIMMGAARKNIVLNQKEKERVAWHEAGHAVVKWGLGESLGGVDKVSIIPRSRSLGVTISLPKEETYNDTEQELRENIAVLYGGRIAEEMKYGDRNTSVGAGNDIERATDIARSMVTLHGMSTLGPLRFVEKQQDVFLGRSIGQQQNVANETAREIDLEVRRIAGEEKDKARGLLEKNHGALEAIAQALLEREELGETDLEAIFERFPITGNDSVMSGNNGVPVRAIAPPPPSPLN